MFKRLPHLGHKSSGSKVSGYPPEDWAALQEVWPDGTWNIPWGQTTSAAEMDDVTRGMLYNSWHREARFAQERDGSNLSPAMFTPDPVPKDWRPSEAIFKQYCQDFKRSPKYMHYVVGRLDSLNRLSA
jgi:hypothetical protein